MNIDKVMKDLENGFTNPQTTLYRVTVEDNFLEQIRLRRRRTGVTHHTIWAFSIGEPGQTPVCFYGHRPSVCIKAALEWRGLRTSSRGKGAQAQIQAG